MYISRSKLFCFSAFIFFFSVISGQCFAEDIPLADNAPVLGITDEDFAREGMNINVIEPWEDGLRTDLKPGTYEW